MQNNKNISLGHKSPLHLAPPEPPEFRVIEEPGLDLIGYPHDYFDVLKRSIAALNVPFSSVRIVPYFGLADGLPVWKHNSPTFPYVLGTSIAEAVSAFPAQCDLSNESVSKETRLFFGGFQSMGNIHCEYTGIGKVAVHNMTRISAKECKLSPYHPLILGRAHTGTMVDVNEPFAEPEVALSPTSSLMTGRNVWISGFGAGNLGVWVNAAQTESDWAGILHTILLSGYLVIFDNIAPVLIPSSSWSMAPPFIGISESDDVVLSRDYAGQPSDFDIDDYFSSLGLSGAVKPSADLVPTAPRIGRFVCEATVPKLTELNVADNWASQGPLFPFFIPTPLSNASVIADIWVSALNERGREAAERGEGKFSEYLGVAWGCSTQPLNGANLHVISGRFLPGPHLITDTAMRQVTALIWDYCPASLNGIKKLHIFPMVYTPFVSMQFPVSGSPGTATALRYMDPTWEAETFNFPTAANLNAYLPTAPVSNLQIVSITLGVENDPEDIAVALPLMAAVHVGTRRVHIASLRVLKPPMRHNEPSGYEYFEHVDMSINGGN